MIKPFSQHLNRKGNIEFRFENIPNNKKPILDRLENCWITINEFDPITKKLKGTCSCPDFMINKMQESPCKHIIHSQKILSLILKINKNDTFK